MAIKHNTPPVKGGGVKALPMGRNFGSGTGTTPDFAKGLTPGKTGTVPKSGPGPQWGHMPKDACAKGTKC